MKTSLKLSLIATLLAVAGVAYSQAPLGGPCDPMMGPGMGMQGPGGHHSRMGNMDPARMQAMMEKRQAVLKAQLKLTPAQEGAWTAFAESMKPAAAMMTMQRPDPVEMAKLTTPQRLDKMKTLRDERMKIMTAAMDKHVEATKTFYAALTAEQQAVFDAAAMSGMGGMHGGRNAPLPMPAAKP